MSIVFVSVIFFQVKMVFCGKAAIYLLIIIIFFYCKCVVAKNTMTRYSLVPLPDLCQVVSSFTWHCFCIIGVNFNSVVKANSLSVIKKTALTL